MVASAARAHIWIRASWRETDPRETVIGGKTVNSYSSAAWRIAASSTGSKRADSGVIGNRSLHCSGPCAPAPTWRWNRVSLDKQIKVQRHQRVVDGAPAKSPASARRHMSAINFGATLAVTEMTPSLPIAIRASAESSLPL